MSTALVAATDTREMIMTTDHPRSTRTRPSGTRDLRLCLAALLAMVYLIAWWAFGSRSQRATATTEAPAVLPTPAQSRLAIWYGDLAPSERPAIHLPAGWQLASSAPSSGPAIHNTPPRSVRVAPARSRRVRTRSS
jgi:hypothetical protein